MILHLREVIESQLLAYMYIGRFQKMYFQYTHPKTLLKPNSF